MKDPDKITPFTFIDQITSKRRILEYDPKVCSGYFMVLHFSFFKELIDIVDKIAPYVFTLSDKAIYEFFMDRIPKGKRFIRWPKKREEDVLDKGIEVLKNKYPNLSKREARMIVSFKMNMRKT